MDSRLLSFLIGAGVACIFLLIFRKELKRRRNAMLKTMKSFFRKGNDKNVE
ncbi:hypothetical protein [Clostridium grantii]|uniref:Uncharacterized protein n=1 Tax=Clostridium grantii DSM 8605 TaxID=1121316 RepID=A0A1M5VG07_9CLOT|nr:hypothetical protein [Clostridium grantii]SHH74088.1 hypothetical protein SAMN02745207_02278 [Clostridium grantii DSM 8605]